jgi:aerobic C4-dicarboxylate transport protein
MDQPFNMRWSNVVANQIIPSCPDLQVEAASVYSATSQSVAASRPKPWWHEQYVLVVAGAVAGALAGILFPSIAVQ